MLSMLNNRYTLYSATDQNPKLHIFVFDSDLYYSVPAVEEVGCTVHCAAGAVHLASGGNKRHSFSF